MRYGATNREILLWKSREELRKNNRNRADFFTMLYFEKGLQELRLCKDLKDKYLREWFIKWGEELTSILFACCFEDANFDYMRKTLGEQDEYR